MKIGYFADGEWSHEAIKYIIKQPFFEIVFIVARYENPDPVLQCFAEELGVPFFVHSNVNSEEFINQIRDYKADIFVSMSFNQILRPTILSVPPLGFINCHAGALPFYRGRNVLNWALINGEKRLGVTVHYVDEGIDTGDIIIQQFVDINENDTYASVLKEAVRLCAKTLYEALILINERKVTVTKQSDIHPVGFYCGMRRQGDEYLDWSWNSNRIHNFIKAITFPGPCARTFLSGREIAIVSSELISDAITYIGKSGEVVGRGNNYIVVKTGDSCIRITEMAFVNHQGTFEKIQKSFTIGTTFQGYFENRITQLEARITALENQIKINK